VHLVTARLRLRPFTLGDAPFILDLLNQPSFIAHIGDRGVRTLAQAARYLAEGPLASYAAHGLGLLAVEEAATGALAGMCGLIRRATLPAVDLGYAFLPGFWGHGYAVEAAAAVVDHGHRVLGLTRLLAIVSPGNAASIRVLQKLGFHAEGALRLPGETEDVACYAWDALTS